MICVGLDPKPDTVSKVIAFNHAIIDATTDLVCAYKPNSAFYEALGKNGWSALSQTILYIKTKNPQLPIILDAKRGDIGNTNSGYIKAAFDELGVDAITVHPYLGEESLDPFFERKDKGIIILAKTSNPGAGEIQDLEVKNPGKKSQAQPLYQYIAHQVADKWNKNGNCALVVGATYPKELKIIRQIIGDMPILIPGVGSQGGEIQSVVSAGKDSQNQGVVISVSRSVLFASSGKDFAEAARNEVLKLNKEVKEALHLAAE